MRLILFVAGVATLLLHPKRFECPRGWWLPEGVRRSGDFVCRPDLVGGVDDRPGGADHSIEPFGLVVGRVFCNAGTVPIVVGSRIVTCAHATSYGR
jgi:hypothetical protein